MHNIGMIVITLGALVLFMGNNPFTKPNYYDNNGSLGWVIMKKGSNKRP